MRTIKQLILDLVPEKLLVIRRYRKEFGVFPNLSQPVLFTEKLQWLKLYDKMVLKTVCSDKLAVRQHVEKRIGSEFLIPLVMTTTNVDDLSQDKLPDYPVIVKPNHDSGGGIVITDKKKADYTLIKKTLSERLSQNYFYFSGEWEYKGIPPCLVVEKLMFDDSGNARLLDDYKLHCFNGKVQYIQTIMDREKSVAETWFDTNWNKQNFGYFSSQRADIPKPVNLELMIVLAEKLAIDFKYVRVDLYELAGQVYFGELTFHPYSGVMKWDPSSMDLHMGSLLSLR